MAFDILASFTLASPYLVLDTWGPEPLQRAAREAKVMILKQENDILRAVSSSDDLKIFGREDPKIIDYNPIHK